MMHKRVLWVVIAIVVVGAGSVYVLRSSPKPNYQTTTKTNHNTRVDMHGTVDGNNQKSTSHTTRPESSTSQLVSGNSNSIITVRSSASVGKYLAAGDGHTLYTYNRDEPDVSNCSSTCAQEWPPYTTGHIGSLPLNVSDIKRSDGRIQYTYKGMPLYFFAGEVAGTVTGNGVGGFLVAVP